MTAFHVDDDPCPPWGTPRPTAVLCPHLCGSTRFSFAQLDQHLKFGCSVLAERRAAAVDRSHPAFRLHTDFELYRSEGGRFRFDEWASRYGDNYDCNAEWLAADYLGSVRRFEDRQDRGEIPDAARMVPFADWLAAETDGYRDAHLWEVS